MDTGLVAIGGPRLNILKELSNAGQNGLTIRELAARLDITPGAVHQTIRKWFAADPHAPLMRGPAPRLSGSGMFAQQYAIDGSVIINSPCAARVVLEILDAGPCTIDQLIQQTVALHIVHDVTKKIYDEELIRGDIRFAIGHAYLREEQSGVMIDQRARSDLLWLRFLVEHIRSA